MKTANRLTILGHVGQPPKLFGKTNKVCRISVGTNRKYRNDNGEWQEVAGWVPITIFNERQASWIAENVSTGDTIYAECHVYEDSYEDKDKQTVYTLVCAADVFDLVAKKSNKSEP